MGQNNSGARICALKTLYKIEQEGTFSNMALKEMLHGSTLSAPDRGLVTTLVYGCVRYRRYLDYVIAQFSSVKLKKLSPYVLLILRLGVYQIMKLDRVPDRAAVDESVKLAGKYAYRAKGFVNALLRRLAAQKEHIRLPEKAAERLGVAYSYPDEIVSMWLSAYGEEFTEQLLAAGNESAPATVRVNTLKTDRAALMDRLRGEGVMAQETWVENMLAFTGAEVAALDSYREGLFIPQGIGSYLAGAALNPNPGDKVLDLCAAPGGKSTHLAQLMQNRGKVYAFDIHEHKLKLIEQNAARMGIDIIETSCADASMPMERFFGCADAVLADVPCSGLGIIRKKPDIKWSFDADGQRTLAELQYRILSAAGRYVKPGGTLVYSTCTIAQAENQDVVERFLRENAAFVPDSLEPYLPKELQRPTAKEGHIQFFPNTDGIDGFFICRMKRKG